jgi:CheY-like chemotaxis protein
MDALLRRLGDEVRESLHQILGAMELMTEDPLSANQRHYLGRCRASADQLLCTANDLAELARTELPPLESAPFRVEGVVAEMAWLLRHLADRRDTEFAWHLDESVPEAVNGDARLLQDLLRKIVESALYLAPRGRIRLDVRAGVEGVLILETSAEAVGETLSDPEFLTAEGLGPALGLSIVRKRLDQINGKLSTFTEGARATLLMTVPYTPAEDWNWSGSEHPSDERAPLNLLIAEDSDDSFFLLQAYVANEGHQLARALNGAQAVDMVKSGQYNFVVMDVKMPVMDGYTATRLIREWETEQGRARLPILLLSAEEAAVQMRTGANAGCSGYLTKPATKAQVLTALEFYARTEVPALP